MTERVVIELIELNDTGAQSRRAKVFGVTAGETHYSYEVPDDDYAGAVVFFLMGFMEGLRHSGREGALLAPFRKVIVAHTDGRLTLRDEDDDLLDDFAGWPDALMALGG